MSESAAPSAEDIGEHLDALYRFARGLVRDPDLAADLVQDTFVRATERGSQYRGDGELLSWLRQVLPTPTPSIPPALGTRLRAGTPT